MSVLTRLFGTKYNDEQLTAQASNAISEDPLLHAASEIIVESERGVITLNGTVARTSEKERVENVVRNALSATGIKYDQIINAVRITN